MKKPITLVSAICSLLFLIAIIVFASGIYIDKKEGTQKAAVRYEELLSKTKENFSLNSYGSPEFSNAFIRAIGNVSDFSSLKLEVNGTLVYSYPPSSFSLPSPELIKSFSESAYIGQTHFTLSASLYLMTPNTVYDHSRLAFLLILVGTLIVSVFIVFTSGTESSLHPFAIPQKKRREFKSFEQFSSIKHSQKTEKGAPPVSKNKENAPEAEAKREESTKTEEITLDEISEQPAHASQEEVKNTSDEQTEELSITFDDDFSAAEEDEEAKPALFAPEDFSDESSSEEAHASVPQPEFTPKQVVPADEETLSIDFPDETPVFTELDEQIWNNEELFDGDEVQEQEAASEEELDIIDQLEQENKAFSDDELFADTDENTGNEDAASSRSPVTNLLLQSALEESADKAIANDSQVTLSLIKINGLDRGNAISQEIISILKKATSDAPAFEYKADSYAILVRTDLQDTVDCFEDIYNTIADYLKNKNATNEVSVGISSASGRKIKAERLILEADQALDYASQDPDSPIVAFRANPQKYQEYLDTNED